MIFGAAVVGFYRVLEAWEGVVGGSYAVEVEGEPFGVGDRGLDWWLELKEGGLGGGDGAAGDGCSVVRGLGGVESVAVEVGEEVESMFEGCLEGGVAGGGNAEGADEVEDQLEAGVLGLPEGMLLDEGVGVVVVAGVDGVGDGRGVMRERPVKVAREGSVGLAHGVGVFVGSA